MNGSYMWRHVYKAMCNNPPEFSLGTKIQSDFLSSLKTSEVISVGRHFSDCGVKAML